MFSELSKTVSRFSLLVILNIAQEPMFIFLSLQAVHAPVQVPESYEEQYQDIIEDDKRRAYAGMTSCMDEGVQNLTNTLKHRGMWENTVLIFSSGIYGYFYLDTLCIILIARPDCFAKLTEYNSNACFFD
tara:strand:- start:289 stop:678 length:390 start_codon:yes stop_codon:yes gene_type:complete